MSLRTRTLAVSSACLLCAAVGAVLVAGRLQRRTADAAALHSLRGVARSFAVHERGDTAKLGAALDALAAHPDLRRAFLARDREELLRVARPMFADLQARSHVTHWYFVEPDRTCFLRVHAPELHGDRVERTTTAVAERSGELAAGKELGLTAFALRAVRPWRDAGGALIGYLELAEEIQHVLERMKEQTGDDFALVVDKEHLDERAWTSVAPTARNTWNDRPDVVVVDTTTFTQGIVDFHGDVDRVPEDGALLETVDRGRRVLARGVFPVRDADGRRVGALFALHDVTALQEAARAASRRGLLAALGLALLLAAALGLALEKLVLARVAALRERLERSARRGKRPQTASPEFHSADDLGKLELLLPDDDPPAGGDPPRGEATPPRSAADGGGT